MNSAEPLTRTIDALAHLHDLTLEQTEAVLGEIMAGHATEIQIAAFLIALRTKGETVEELTGLARTMRSSPSRSHRSARTCWTPRAPAAAGGPSTSRPRRR